MMNLIHHPFLYPGSFSQELESNLFPSPLNIGWPCDLLWPMEWWQMLQKQGLEKCWRDGACPLSCTSAMAKEHAQAGVRKSEMQIAAPSLPSCPSKSQPRSADTQLISSNVCEHGQNQPQLIPRRLERNKCLLF